MPKFGLYDPNSAPANYDPSLAEAIDLLDGCIDADQAWTRDTITAGLQVMAAAPKRSLPWRAIDVIEKRLGGQGDPIGALEALGRPQHDQELMDVKTYTR